MPYADSVSLEIAVEGLNFRDVLEKDDLIHTKGLWHVLIALRHVRLLGAKEKAFRLTQGYDMAEACFDLNGIFLPIDTDSREVFFEPAATGAKNPGGYFRHRQGPRQTYQNRIQTGLGGGGPRQPGYFDVTSQSLPTDVSLKKEWIDSLRAYPPHCFILDERITELFTFIFRFGIPEVEGSTASIGVDETGNGNLILREGITFASIEPETFKAKVSDFFGLREVELDKLFPNLSRINFEAFDDPDPLKFESVQYILKSLYLRENHSSSEVSVTTSRLSLPLLDWSKFEGDVNTIGFTGAPEILAKCLAALRAGKHLILLGPPGGGKTMLAKGLCETACSNGIPGYTLTTATSDWSTFETIGGYMPSAGSPNQLDFSPGIITSAILDQKWLLIDEFNRADIDKAFGEMFTLLSGHRIHLPFSKEDKPIIIHHEGSSTVPDCFNIVLPRTWRIIATMNTFDKASLFQMSYALMRRFAFINVDLPKSDDLKTILGAKIDLLAASPIIQADSKDFLISMLDAFFATTGTGLSEFNLQLGPAIALDCLSYLDARIARFTALTADEFVKIAFEAIEMYVFPQFEGRDLMHGTIVDVISKSGFAAIGKDVISEKLSLWTGFEEG